MITVVVDAGDIAMVTEGREFCPVVSALKKQFRTTRIRVGFSRCYVAGKLYQFDTVTVRWLTRFDDDESVTVPHVIKLEEVFERRS